MVEVAPRIVVEALKTVTAELRAIVPELMIVPPESWLPAVIEVTVPKPVVERHEPFTTRQPPERTRPFAKVEVPADTERPAEDARPAALMPPLKDEVADDVLRREPPVMVRPFAVASPPPPETESPPAKVEVALLPRIVVVAVEPTKIDDVAERLVVDAFWKSARPP